LTTIIPASLAAARPHGRAVPDAGISALESEGGCSHASAPTAVLRSGFLLATLPLFTCQRPRRPCRSQAVGLLPVQRSTAHGRPTALLEQ